MSYPVVLHVSFAYFLLEILIDPMIPSIGLKASRKSHTSLERRKGVHSEVDVVQSAESDATYKRTELEGNVDDKEDTMPSYPVHFFRTS